MKRSRLRRSNLGRRARTYKRNFAGPWAKVHIETGRLVVVGHDHGKWLRAMPCAVETLSRTQSGPCRRPSSACHVRARGMGGAKGDWSDLVPLCQHHHRMLDETCANRPARFYELTAVDLAEYAAHLADHARRTHGEAV